MSNLLSRVNKFAKANPSNPLYGEMAMELGRLQRFELCAPRVNFEIQAIVPRQVPAAFARYGDQMAWTELLTRIENHEGEAAYAENKEEV